MIGTLLPLLLLAAPQSPWTTEVALQAPVKLGGCAAGDLLAERAGLELLATGEDGSIFLAWTEEGAWKRRRILQTSGEMIQCATGDLLPELPGDEAVVVGMRSGPEADAGPGAAWLLARRDGIWKAELLLEAPALLHGVGIRDGAVFVTGFTRELQTLRRTGDDWDAETACALPGAGKVTAPYGDGMLVACNDGSLVVAEPGGDGWQSRVLHRRDAGRSRLGVFEDHVLTSDDDGASTLVSPHGSRVLHEESAKMRGAVLADLEPAVPGLEAATAGYGGVLMLHVRDGDGEVWRAVPLVRETDRFHHLGSEDLDGDGQRELFACGYAGRLLVLRRVLRTKAE